MRLDHHGNLARVESYEVARRVHTDELREATHEVLIELRPVLASQHGQDAVGRKRLLVGTLRPHGVVHVRDAAEHRAEVERGARRPFGIAAAVEPQVMLERHDGRERRHIGRGPQDLCAVDDVALHDREFRLGEHVRLVENLERCAHLPDVVHERGQPELAQQRTVDAKRPRLRHRQDRHVHHVGEGVVVVLLQRSERHQGRAVLRHRLGEAVDHRAGHGGVRASLDARTFPDAAGRLHGLRVEAAERGHIGRAALDAFGYLYAPDAQMRERGEAGGRLLGRVGRGHEASEHGNLGGHDAAVDRHALDADATQPVHQRNQRTAGRHRQVVHDHFVAHHADDNRGRHIAQRFDGSLQTLEVAGDERMSLRVQLARTQRRGEAAEQFFRELGRQSGRH